jgi:hypothetical protein
MTMNIMLTGWQERKVHTFFSMRIILLTGIPGGKRLSIRQSRMINPYSCPSDTLHATGVM